MFMYLSQLFVLFMFSFLLVSNNSNRKLTETSKDFTTEIPIKIEAPQRSKSVKVKKEELPLNQRSLRSVRSNWKCHIVLIASHKTYFLTNQIPIEFFSILIVYVSEKIWIR